MNTDVSVRNIFEQKNYSPKIALLSHPETTNTKIRFLEARLCWLSKRNNVGFRIKKFSVFLVNQKMELKPCLAISLKIATQSAQAFSLKKAFMTIMLTIFMMTVVLCGSWCPHAYMVRETCVGVPTSQYSTSRKRYW